jgi:hypothetical protein
MTDMNKIRLVLFDLNNRIVGHYLAAIDRILSMHDKGLRDRHE